MFYWIDFTISTITTIVFSVQWFVYTDHSLPDVEDNPEQKQQHDDSFKAESIVSIVILCLVRLIHVRHSSDLLYEDTKIEAFLSFILPMWLHVTMYLWVKLIILR